MSSGTLALTPSPRFVCLAHSYVHMVVFLIKLLNNLSSSRRYRKQAMNRRIPEIQVAVVEGMGLSLGGATAVVLLFQ